MSISCKHDEREDESSRKLSSLPACWTASLWWPVRPPDCAFGLRLGIVRCVCPIGYSAAGVNQTRAALTVLTQLEDRSGWVTSHE